MTPQSTPNSELALEFARAVSSGDTGGAYGLLSASLKSQLSVGQLKADYEQMVSYGEGEPEIVQVMTTLTEWPDKQADDTEWVYVAIANDTYSEAVTVVVARQGPTLVIRSIEWGRP